MPHFADVDKHSKLEVPSWCSWKSMDVTAFRILHLHHHNTLIDNLQCHRDEHDHALNLRLLQASADFPWHTQSKALEAMHMASVQILDIYRKYHSLPVVPHYVEVH